MKRRYKDDPAKSSSTKRKTLKSKYQNSTLRGIMLLTFFQEVNSDNISVTSALTTSVASGSQASTSQASTSHVSTSQASTSHASTSQASTSQASTSQASTSQAPSALPPTSKKIQKKIDKQLALQDFRMKTKSNTEKTCPSCGLHTHSRSSSNLCPKKKQKEPSHNPDEKKETFAIKSSLKNICTDTRVYKKIALVVAYTTKAIHISSLFMNYIFLKLLNKGEQVPIIDHTLVYSISLL